MCDKKFYLELREHCSLKKNIRSSCEMLPQLSVFKITMFSS